MKSGSGSPGAAGRPETVQQSAVQSCRPSHLIGLTVFKKSRRNVRPGRSDDIIGELPAGAVHNPADKRVIPTIYTVLLSKFTNADRRPGRDHTEQGTHDGR